MHSEKVHGDVTTGGFSVKMSDTAIVEAVVAERQKNEARATRSFPSAVEISVPQALATNPLVSVEVVTYRHERVLGQCVESILTQQVDFPYEIIIGVDNSPDRTLEVAKQLQAEHPDKIRVLAFSENVGLNQNSKCVRMAMRGRFAALLEGDDWWLPGKLQKQINYMQENERCALCFSPELFFYEGTGQLLEQRIRCVPRRQDWVACMIGHSALPETSSVVCKARDLKAIYEEAPSRLSSRWMCQDVQLFASLAERGEVFCWPEALAVRRFSASSITGATGVVSQLVFLDNVYGFVALMERECHVSWWERNTNVMRHFGQMLSVLADGGYGKASMRRILRRLYPDHLFRLSLWFSVGLFLRRLDIKNGILRNLVWSFLFPVVARRKMFVLRPYERCASSDGGEVA